MKDSFKQSMDWLHTWGGLVFGWLLFAIFLTGTLTVFDKEITWWMQPELHGVPRAEPDVAAVEAQLAALGPRAERWWIELPGSRSPAVRIYWQNPGEDTTEERHLHPTTGHILPVRHTLGGELFYHFHYELLLDELGVWIVGAAALVMLAALITGLVIHRRIFKDFFEFRPWATSHRAWLDIHNVTSVFVLPFHFVITFSGLAIFWMVYMPAGVSVLYHGNTELAAIDLEQRLSRRPANDPVPLRSLAELEHRARAYWNGGMTEWIEVHHPGDRHATVEVSRRPDDRVALLADRVTFDGTTGEILQFWRGERPAFLTYSFLIGLHYIWFDQTVIRWLYFVMGLSATAMIGTGLILWTVKRRERHVTEGSAVGYRLVETLNVAIIAGLPAATGVFFWANRLLPVELNERSSWEVRLFFLAWALCALHACLRQASGLHVWKEQLSAAALLFGLLPVLNLLTTNSHLLATLPTHTWRLAAVDLVGLGAGLLNGAAAWRIGRPRGLRSQARVQPAMKAEQA